MYNHFPFAEFKDRDLRIIYNIGIIIMIIGSCFGVYQSYISGNTELVAILTQLYITLLIFVIIGLPFTLGSIYINYKRYGEKLW